MYQSHPLVEDRLILCKKFEIISIKDVFNYDQKITFSSPKFENFEGCIVNQSVKRNKHHNSSPNPNAKCSRHAGTSYAWVLSHESKKRYLHKVGTSKNISRRKT